MKKKLLIFAFLACVLVVALDAAAGVLGYKAEAAQDHGEHLRFWFIECKKPTPQAFNLGIAAVVLLGVAHLITSFANGCKSGNIVGKIFLILTWIGFAIAFILLIVGALSNHSSRSSCGLSRHRLLSKGGFLCFVHGGIAVVYIVAATVASATATTTTATA